MRSFMVGALLSLLCSCTHTTYLSSGDIPVYIGARNKHNNKISAEGDKSFFFWGIVPAEHKVYVDRELAQQGLVSAANMTVEEYQKWDDFVVGILSFGMFIKKSYRISAYGMQADKE